MSASISEAWQVVFCANVLPEVLVLTRCARVAALAAIRGNSASRAMSLKAAGVTGEWHKYYIGYVMLHAGRIVGTLDIHGNTTESAGSMSSIDARAPSSINNRQAVQSLDITTHSNNMLIHNNTKVRPTFMATNTHVVTENVQSRISLPSAMRHQGITDRSDGSKSLIEAREPNMATTIHDKQTMFIDKKINSSNPHNTFTNAIPAQDM